MAKTASKQNKTASKQKKSFLDGKFDEAIKATGAASSLDQTMALANSGKFQPAPAELPGLGAPSVRRPESARVIVNQRPLPTDVTYAGQQPTKICDWAVYCRSSDAVLSPTSANDQKEAILEDLLHQGIKPKQQHIYIDEDIPGRFFESRPELQRMLADAKRRSFGAVMIDLVSRLGRRVAATIKLYEQLTFYGVALFARGLGRLTLELLTFLALLAQLENRERGNAIRRGVRRKVARGDMYTGGAMPYGFMEGPEDENGNVTLVPDPKTAPYLIWIFERVAAGMSRGAICHLLNQRAVPGPFGGIWYPTSLWLPALPDVGILRNKKYIGYASTGKLRVYFDPSTERDVRFAMPHDAWKEQLTENAPLMPASLFWAVQEICDEWADQAARWKAAGLRPHVASAPRTIFRSSKFYCPSCRFKMVVLCGSSGSARIGCGDAYGSHKTGVPAKCKNSRTFEYKLAVKAVVKTVAEVLANDPKSFNIYIDAWNRAAAKDVHTAPTSREETLRRELERIEGFKEKVLVAWERGKIAEETFDRRTAAHDARKTALQEELESIGPQKRPTVSRVDRPSVEKWHKNMNSLAEMMWSAMNTEEGQILVGALDQLVEEVALRARPRRREMHLAIYGPIALLAGKPKSNRPVERSLVMSRESRGNPDHAKHTKEKRLHFKLAAYFRYQSERWTPFTSGFKGIRLRTTATRYSRTEFKARRQGIIARSPRPRKARKKAKQIAAA